MGGKRVPVSKTTFTNRAIFGHGGIVVLLGHGDNSVGDSGVRGGAGCVRFVVVTRDLACAEGFLIMDTCYDLSSVKMVTLSTVSF